MLNEDDLQPDQMIDLVEYGIENAVELGRLGKLMQDAAQRRIQELTDTLTVLKKHN